MDAIQAIMTRRSIRTYTGEPVSEEEVQQLLRAAMAAPSAGNQQPWHFVVVRDQETRRRVTEVHPYSAMLPEAEVCIAVCAELALQKHEGYWVQDCSAATQNILLAAHALGLGAVWLGVHPTDDRKSGVREILGLPDGVECLALVSVGRPAEEAGPADRYHPDRVHDETW